MKINLHYIVICLIGTACIFSPVSAVVAGNSTPGAPVYPVNAITAGITYMTPTPVPSLGISAPVNLPGQAVVLVIGIIIIIIAITGLIWRYLHPKYVPPERKKE